MTLKILYFIDALESNYPRDQNYIIKYMAEKGHDTYVVTSKDPKFQSYDVLLSPARVIRAPRLFSIRKARVYLSHDVLRLGVKKWDVVHAFTFFTFSASIGAFMKSDVKVIRSEVGSPNGATFIKAKNIKLYVFLREFYKKFYTYFVVYNDVERKNLEFLGFPRERVVVLPPMIDYVKFSSLSRNTSSRSITVGTIARLSPEKGIHRLIKIINVLMKEEPRLLRKTRWCIAGRIDDEKYGVTVLRHLKSLLGERFEYFGEIAPPYDFYTFVDIAIVPSISETGAIAVLEAMAAGKVIIASDIYPINLYINHGENGFLFKEEYEAAKILRELLSGSINVRTISRNAQNYAIRHDYRAICKKLERVYYNA